MSTTEEAVRRVSNRFQPLCESASFSSSLKTPSAAVGGVITKNVVARDKYKERRIVVQFQICAGERPSLITARVPMN